MDHAYPTRMKGWLVLVLKRHAEALHELSTEEYTEMAALLERTVRLLRSEMGCAKEYAMCFAEAEHFNHIHLHVVPRLRWRSKGAAVTALPAGLRSSPAVRRGTHPKS